MFASQRLKISRIGRAWMAIREDEIAAAAIGVSRVKYKLLAFAIGAAFAGATGTLYVAKLRTATPEMFMFPVSVMNRASRGRPQPGKPYMLQKRHLARTPDWGPRSERPGSQMARPDRESQVSPTLCWRGVDSNHQFRESRHRCPHVISASKWPSLLTSSAIGR